MTLAGMDLATKLLQATEKRGWSQADLRRMLNDRLDDGRVSKYMTEAWFAGKSRPDATIALALSEILDIDLHFLCDDRIEEPPSRPEITEDERMVLRMFRTSGLTAEEAVRRMLIKQFGIAPRT